MTFNVWSGLDYKGIFKMGEYETDSIREKRFDILFKNIQSLSPDIIFLQEVNPAGSYSGKLASLIGYDEIHQVCNAGLKIGPIGLPSNLKEGNTILAKSCYYLEEVEVLKLSGGFGLHGDVFSFHFDDAIFAQIAKVNINGKEIYLINTHLTAEGSSGSEKRIEQIRIILEYIGEKLKNVPIIIGGDFNATPESPEIRLLKNQGKFIDCFTNTSSPGYTWDPAGNTNVSYSLKMISEDSAALKEAEYDSLPKRIDYIFVNDPPGTGSVKKTDVVLNIPEENIYSSDHFGVLSSIELDEVPQKDNKKSRTDWDAIPIASYDTDFGFGAGFKAFLLNQLGYQESLDFTLYYSTKGERWYRFVFSLPDFELRQKTIYPAAIDLIVDYDRMNQNSFFGVGNSSDFDEREYYTREPFEIKLQFNRGFTPTLVLQGGLKYKYVTNFNFEDSSRLVEMGGLSSSKSYYSAIYAGFRYDSRNSFINPTRGTVLEGEIEYAPDLSFNNVSFERISLNTQYFVKLFYPQTVLASRLQVQGLIGDDIPIQNLLSIGGNNTLRGYPQDRFMDKISAVFNAELRFPIFWRFGGLLGLDAGNVWHEASLMSFKYWKINPAAGLRFYFDTFIVRMDFGFSSESTGFYLNFGHIF